MISNASVFLFSFVLLLIAIFVGWSFRTRRKMQLIHKLYLCIAVLYAVWLIALLCMRFTASDNMALLFFWDAVTNSVGAFIPVLSLWVTLSFAKNYAKMPPWGWTTFLVPILSNLVIWTNPIFHLQYRVFSVIRSEIVFGPYIAVSGIYSYLCLLAGMLLMINFAWRNRSRLYTIQCLLYTAGTIPPLVVSTISTLTDTLPITATPISFIPTVLLSGIAVYRFHVLDIKPLATQHVLDWTSDCYLVLSDTGLVISYNRPFANIFASQFGITENQYLEQCVRQEDVANKTAVYHLLTGLASCRQSRSGISYEQAVTLQINGTVQKNYYLADISPLIIRGDISGFVVIYKDITQLKKSMEQLQASQNRMAEQERLASLGQMIGGVAHNLKTPIMGISGCISAAEALVEECLESLEDPQVTPDDFREIYRELQTWFEKVRESTSYMSDIITAIKGQAANVGTSQDTTFTVEELMKRAMLLMRHELFQSGCYLEAEYEPGRTITLHGDINNLVQILNNLIANAAHAQKQTGGGAIGLGVRTDDENLMIYVRDTGPGVSPKVRNKLFREMVTSKGTQGTGLGLYISNVVVRGKFGGSMWLKDNPGGGSIFGFSIPLQNVTITDEENKRGGEFS